MVEEYRSKRDIHVWIENHARISYMPVGMIIIIEGLGAKVVCPRNN